MSNKKILLLALFFGVVTALAMNYYLQQIKTAANDIDVKQVVVANVKIPSRTVISGEMLTLKEIPVEFIHPDAVTNQEDVIGLVTATDISAGEQVLREKLIQKQGNPVGLSYIVPLGTRAMSVPVNEVSSIGGLVKPGDRVDVVGTMELEIPNPQAGAIPLQQPLIRTKVTNILLQNVEVLAVGGRLGSAPVPGPEGEPKEAEGGQSNPGANNVTLAVPVDKMQVIALMADHGKVTLALRSPVDESKYDRLPVTDSEFLRK